MKLFNKKNWKVKGLDAIKSHSGKNRVYNNLLQKNPGLAEQYLRFVARNSDAVYISWDKEKQCFVG